MDALPASNEFSVEAGTIHNVTYNIHSSDGVVAKVAQDQHTTADDAQLRSSTEIPSVNCGANGFQVYKLEAECEMLMNSGHHFQAVERLKRLHQFQPGHVKTMLMFAECYYNLEKYDDCFEIAQKVREAILHSPRPETRDLILEAIKCRKEKMRLNSLVILWSCCSLFETDRNPSDAVDGINECIHMIDNLQVDVIVEEEENTQQSAKRFSSIVFLMIEEIENTIKRIEIEDGDLHAKVLLRCLGCKGDCWRYFGEYEKAQEIYRHCIKQMEEKFRGNASKSYMYGEFLANVAECYYQKGEYEKCDEFIEKTRIAISVCQPTTEGEKSSKKIIEEWLKWHDGDYEAEALVETVKIKDVVPAARKGKFKFKRLLLKRRKK